jgi:multidrug efflux system membrane fusion protein
VRHVPSLGNPALIITALLLAGCGNAGAPPPPPPVTVDVAPVTVRDLRQWDDFEARLEPIQSVEIRPRVGGYIDMASFPEGAHVRHGQLLFQIDPRPFKAEVARLNADLQSARAKAVLARSDADRAGRLINQDAIARNEFERLDAVAKSAAADAASAQASLTTARLNLSFTRVTSPIDGRVSKVLITRGNLVSPTDLLTTVVSDGPIYASFNADEQTFLKYLALQRGGGSPVYMGLMTEDGFPHAGRLQFLDNRVDARSGTIDGRAFFANSDGRLTPGLFARVRLVAASSASVALVPEDAIGSDLGKRFVLVVDRTSHAQYRLVTLGSTIGTLRVVQSGLQRGDMIVVNGLNKIKPGDPVTAVRTRTAIGPDEEAALDSVSAAAAGPGR